MREPAASVLPVLDRIANPWASASIEHRVQLQGTGRSPLPQSQRSECRSGVSGADSFTGCA